MNIVSSDARKCISIGGYDTWKVLCSTIRYHMSPLSGRISRVLNFIETGHCSSGDCLETAREFNLVRDHLSRFQPDQIIYDEDNPGLQPPWGDNISPVITSCANYLTTGDGDDLLAEIVKLLTYAYYAKADVDVES